MIYDEELKRFHDWLQEKGDDPKIVLAPRWIAEFEVYAEDDEEAFREAKALAQLRSKYDPDAAAALKVITWVEETVEPHPMLKRLQHWLEAKGNDPSAALVGWWLAEFDKAQEPGCTQTTVAPTLH